MIDQATNIIQDNFLDVVSSYLNHQIPSLREDVDQVSEWNGNSILMENVDEVSEWNWDIDSLTL